MICIKTQGSLYPAVMKIEGSEWDGVFHYCEDIDNEENKPLYYFLSTPHHQVSRCITGEAEDLNDAISLAEKEGVFLKK